MTTEELEKKLKISRLKISKNTCIHCPTLELAKQVLNIFHQLDLKWCDGTHYTLNPNWDWYKENTVYYPFDGKFTSLKLPQAVIINAKEFISLHTVKEKYNLENYTPKGDLQGFPKEIISRMLDCQEEQGNPRDISVFEKQRDEGKNKRGFTWENTKEGNMFWSNVLTNKDFGIFFRKYPKQEYQELKNNKNMQENNKKEDDSQDFRINDKVYDILRKEVGVVQDIDYSSSIPYGLSVEIKSGLKSSYTTNGRYTPECKNPQILHYRDDYDYSIIDFNNLPKRQEPKRWRAEKGGEYHYVRFYLEGWFCTSTSEDSNDYYDNLNYNSGNYFRTESEAKIIAQKLNTHFKQLIQEEHEHERN